MCSITVPKNSSYAFKTSDSQVRHKNERCLMSQNKYWPFESVGHYIENIQVSWTSLISIRENFASQSNLTVSTTTILQLTSHEQTFTVTHGQHCRIIQTSTSTPRQVATTQNENSLVNAIINRFPRNSKVSLFSNKPVLCNDGAGNQVTVICNIRNAKNRFNPSYTDSYLS